MAGGVEMMAIKFHRADLMTLRAGGEGAEDFKRSEIGEVCGPFGIHSEDLWITAEDRGERDGKYERVWIVTHVPTGYCVMTCRWKRCARAAVADILEETEAADWSATDHRKLDKKRLGPIVALVSERYRALEVVSR